MIVEMTSDQPSMAHIYGHFSSEEWTTPRSERSAHIITDMNVILVGPGHPHGSFRNS